MGLRDMEAFNYALLAKQGWRLMQNPNSLVARVLKVKYFHDSTFLQAKLGTRPSYMWRSIWEGKKILQMGRRWRVGNEDQIRVWHDPWVPVPFDFKVLTRNQFMQHSMWVKDLIDQDQRVWKQELVVFYLCKGINKRSKISLFALPPWKIA